VPADAGVPRLGFRSDQEIVEKRAALRTRLAQLESR
jgi:hypothetical protein